MKLYNELAEWWHILSPVEDYKEESSLYNKIISKHKRKIKSALELGSGGGNNAFHLKNHYQMTLVDLSSKMISQSKKINPRCNHFLGDMRTIDLNKKFDLVFIHDAIMYMNTENDLLKVFSVANSHLNDNGVLFIVPDYYLETYTSYSSEGGSDCSGKSVRYLEWSYDQDPNDGLIENIMTYILKDEDGNIKVEYDHTSTGIFSKNTWKKLLQKSGFNVSFEKINYTESEVDLEEYYAIVCNKI